MQFGGPAIEDQNTKMYNCSFTHIDRPRVFQEIFYLLLCGCGVGYSIQTQHVNKLPPILPRDTKKLRHYTVDDTTQGVADSIGVLMDSFFTGYYVEFSYHEIRPQGSPLKTSGGKAPGHFPLKHLHNILTTKLLTIHNRNLRPIEVHDILCHIADSVLSGGIRRSSLISIFSIDDEEMLYCKMPEEFEHYGINGQRALANNSAVLFRSPKDLNDVSTISDNEADKKDFLKIMKLNKDNPNGEPGFFFTNDLDYGCNPCGEIGLYPVLDIYPEDDFPNTGIPITSSGQIKRRESGVAFCNLTEINCAVIKTKEEFYDACRAASIIGTLQAAYTDFPYLGHVTEEIVKRDALLGVSLTGMMDNPKLSLDGDWQQHGVTIIKETNIEVAKLLNINPAKRLTTIKPSGTASLLLGGVASGIHPHHSKRYFRRVTANKNESVAQHMALFNPQMIEHKPNGDLSLVFPVEAPKITLTLDNLDVANFLAIVFETYDNWIKPGGNYSYNSDLTHNISCTVCFKPEEYEQMVETIWLNRNRIAAMSFIPHMSDKLLPYMPRESVVTDSDKVKWNQLVKDYTPIDYSQLKETTNNRSDLSLELACSADNQECGTVSVDIEDTVEVAECWLDHVYTKVGDFKDIFGAKLYMLRRK
jgi:ribonucleoside-diphosphate reductase alpha chain